MKQDTECWELPAVIEKYTGELYLLQGERLAFASAFTEGLNAKRILDLGCGGGRTTFFLNQVGAAVVGLDISRNLIQAAQERFADINFQVGDAAVLPFKNDSFDAVLFSFNSLDCLYPKDQRIQSIREICRVLRTNGRFILSHHSLSAFFFGWYKCLSPKKLLFRFFNIINGNFFKPECYLRTPDNDCEWLILYYAWPNHFIGDLESHGFQLMNIYPNSPLLGFMQKTFSGGGLTKLADPWPYYVFQKK